MALSRGEINFRRLLNKCEIMIKTKQKDDERFPKYVESLDGMLKDLQISELRLINEDTIDDYHYRIDKLKIALGLSTVVENGIGEKNKLSPREELLGLKHRNVQKTKDSNDLDELLDYHEGMQQKIADDMLTLTRNLKEQSELANKIIKKDTEVVGRSAQLTDTNFSKLKVESNKLTEHSKKAWKCWMWIMLVIVMVVFISKRYGTFYEGNEEKILDYFILIFLIYKLGALGLQC